MPLSPSGLLAKRLAAAGLGDSVPTSDPSPDGRPLRYIPSPDWTPEQIAAAEAILASIPDALAIEEARSGAYAQAAAYGCPVTIGERTIVFAMTPTDYATLLADLGGMVDLDQAGEPDAPEYLADKDSVIHEFPTRASARAYIREYRRLVKGPWAALWKEQEALHTKLNSASQLSRIAKS